VSTSAKNVLIVLLGILCILLTASLAGVIGVGYMRYRDLTDKALFVELDNGAMLCQFDGNHSVHLFNTDTGGLERVYPPLGTIGIDITRIGTTPNAVIGSFTSYYGKPPSGYFVVRIAQRTVHTFATVEELRRFMSDNKIPEVEAWHPIERF
jgi:hypothetical protein